MYQAFSQIFPRAVVRIGLWLRYLVKPLEWDPLVRLEIDDILRSLVRVLVTEYVLLWV
jgi:hypothetical protein